MITDSIFRQAIADVASVVDKLASMAHDSSSLQARETALALIDRLNDCFTKHSHGASLPPCTFTIDLRVITPEPEQHIGYVHANSWEELGLLLKTSVGILRTKMSLQHDRATIVRKHPDIKDGQLGIIITRAIAGEPSAQAADLLQRGAKSRGGRPRYMPKRALLKGASKPDLSQYANKLRAAKEPDYES